MRAILEACKRGGLDLDTVFKGDANQNLIDANLTYSFLLEEDKPDFEKSLGQLLVGNEADCIHFLRQFGFMKCKCRNDLKMHTHERGTPRDPESSTRLMDFAKDHPQLFDLLWSVFAVCLSATRIIESAHGFQRETYDSQRPLARNDAQLRYMMEILFAHRRERRKKACEEEGKDEEEDKKRSKSAKKHCDRKYLHVMAGVQMNELLDRYSEAQLEDRFSEEELCEIRFYGSNFRTF